MKARFTTEQPAVSWQPLDNGMVDVTICLNGQEVTEENQQMVEKEQYITVTDTFWEYDFHQFREKAENVNREAVEKNPELWECGTTLTKSPISFRSSTMAFLAS